MKSVDFAHHCRADTKAASEDITESEGEVKTWVPARTTHHNSTFHAQNCAPPQDTRTHGAHPFLNHVGWTREIFHG